MYIDRNLGHVDKVSAMDKSEIMLLRTFKTY